MKERMTAGQRRKLGRNLLENLTARQIGVAGFLVARMLVVVLTVLGMTAFAHALTTHAGNGTLLLAAAPLVSMPVRDARRKGMLANPADLMNNRKFSRETFGRHTLAVPRNANPRVDPNVAVEVIDAYLYDSFTVAVATAFPKTTLFQTPVGSGAKTLAQTNIAAAGRLEGGNRFMAATVQIWISNDTNPVDLLAIYRNVSMQLFFGNKQYAVGPPQLYPAGCGGVITAVANNTAGLALEEAPYTTSNGVLDPRAVFVYEPAIDVLEDENISAVFTPETGFSTVAAAPGAGHSVGGNGTTIMLILAGKRIRPIS